LWSYNNFLLDRKVDVGLEERPTEVARDFYVFAKSLTDEGHSGADDFDGDDLDDDCQPGGWLLRKGHLLEKMVPIDVLKLPKIKEAARNWKEHLSKATIQLRKYHLELAGETTHPDGCKRVEPILKMKNPLNAIEFGVFRLAEQIKDEKRYTFRWATAIRASLTLKLHAQVPLRRKTFSGLTYATDNSGMVKFENGKWWLEIPGSLFKNEKSKVFREDYPDGFRHNLLDLWGLYKDLQEYVDSARTIILSGVESPAFYVAQHNAGHVTPGAFADNFRKITKEFIAYNAGRGTGLKGVKPFGSHAMRHIVATAVWKSTRSLDDAARAIHDTTKMTEKHYKHYVLDLARQNEIVEYLMPNSRWPRQGEVLLPQVSSPSSVPRTPNHTVSAPAMIKAPKDEA
jgi:integrase